MISLADIRDWLKTFKVGRSFYIGKLDAKEEMSIGVYQRKASGRPRTAIGGLDTTGYEVKAVSVLVHWNRNARETEEAAQRLFERLRGAKNIVLSGHRVPVLVLEVPEPQDVGTDDTGIYERVIWFDLYVER